MKKKTKSKPITTKAKPTTSWAGRWKKAKAAVRGPARAARPMSADAREELERRRRVNARGEAMRRARAAAILGEKDLSLDVPHDWLQPGRNRD